MELGSRNAVFFIDLDEVLVTRLAGGETHDVVVVIQPAAADELKSLSSRIIVLTHRSRGEALQILRSIPGITDSIDDVVAADDLIRAALLTGQFHSLVRRGIQKNLYVRMAQMKYGVKPHRIAILDDNSGNVDGMLAGGCGLGILAPCPTITDGRIATYDLGAAVAEFRSFRDGSDSGQIRIQLPANRYYALGDLPRIQVAHSRLMNGFRRIAKIMRQGLSAGK